VCVCVCVSNFSLMSEHWDLVWQTPACSLHFNSQKATLVFKIYDIQSQTNDDIIKPLKIIQNIVKKIQGANDAVVLVDLRHAKGFKFTMLWPIVQWIKESRDIFSKHLDCTYIVTGSNSVWVTIFNSLMMMVKTSRPVHIASFEMTSKEHQLIINSVP